MDLKNHRRFLIIGVNFIVLLVVLMFQACGKDYGVSLQSVGLPPKCRTGNCVTAQVNPEMDVVRPPTKVLFVVDNSRTMKLSQTYLASGANSLAKDLRGFDADFYIYSTSDKHGKKTDIDGNEIDKDDKPVLASKPLKSCKWTEMVDGKPVEKSGGDCPNNDKTEYLSELLNIINPSLSTGSGFRASFSVDELNLASNKLSEAITSVGVDGSSSETGLCSLVRAVYNESEHSIFKKGDNAAMVIMSDEDDASSVSTCISRTTEKESFVGRPAETQPCNPTTEKCDVVDYKVEYNAVTKPMPSVELKADYKCDQTSNGSCAVNGNCTGVKYTFNNLESKVSYSCLNKVDYLVKFNDVISYSRTLNYSCFSKVPYTISFNNSPTYSQTMSYQCEQLEDGVPVATSTPKIIALQNSGSPCQNGAEVACDSNAISKAVCSNGTRLLTNTCKLKCVVGSKPESDITFNDTDALAMGRDLTNTSFTLNSVSYSDLYDWAAKKYPNLSVKTGGIVKGNSDASNQNPITLPGLNSSCTNGELIDCNSDQLSQAVNSCGVGNKNVVVNSCRVKCVVTSTPSSVTYSDTRADADLYDLRSTSFSDGGQTYSDLTAWGNSKHSPKTVSSVTRTVNNSSLAEKFVGSNCSVADSVGADCSAEDLAWTASSMACNGKKVMACKRKCMGDPKTFVLPNLSEDKVNFCTNMNGNFKFAKVKDGTPEFTSIEAYANATFNVGTQSAKITNCVRVGDGTVSVAQTPLTLKIDNQTCEGLDRASAFAGSWTGKCNGSNPKQNGITDGSKSYGCTDKTVTVTEKPALTEAFTYSPVDKENICNSSLKVGNDTFASLKDYLKTKNGRTDLPVACSIVAARKTRVPAGVVSAGKTTQAWSFPKTVSVNDPEANLEKAFVNRSIELFGENGFFVSAIIRDTVEDQKFNCPPLDGHQSIGTKYRALVENASVRSTGAKGDVTSICATDYSKALSSVSSWIKENARRTVFLPAVKEGDEILSVWLVNQATGQENHLNQGTDYEVVGNKVNFINPSIDLKGWLINYIYWEPLKPEEQASAM